MRFTIISLLALLAGCAQPPQEAVDNASTVCKDGVEYFVYEKWNSKSGSTYSVVPHFKPDGTLYTC